MREVEAEILVADVGALLLDMGAQDLAESLVEQVGAGMVVGDFLAFFRVDGEGEQGPHVGRDALGDMDGQVVFLDGSQDLDDFARRGRGRAGVADLAAHLPVERGAVEDQLDHLLVLGPDRTVFHQLRLIGECVVARELAAGERMDLDPVAVLHGRGIAGAFLLLAELDAEAVHVHLEAVLGSDEFRQVDRETERVVEGEGVDAGDDHRTAALLHHRIHELDALVEGAQEGFFLFADHALHELLLCHEFGIGLAHVTDQLGHQAAEERLLQAEERVAVAHGTAQDAADDVAGLHVAGQLAVGD